MKKFVYQVASFEFVDTVAFGEAWQEAKQTATAHNAEIYRLVIKGESVKQEVFTKAGCFLSTKYATAENVAIF